MLPSRLPYLPIVFAVLLSHCGQPFAPSSGMPVVGGHPARQQGFMAAVGGEPIGRQFCGGAFIRKDIVVTAAHCVHQTHEQFWVGVGIHNLKDLDSHNKVPVKAVKIHPQFDPATSLDHDIALLFLDPRVLAELDLPVSPISLDEGNPVDTYTALGWGNSTSNGAYFEDELQEASLPAISNEACRQAGGAYANIRDDQLCAGDLRQGGVDTCQGDSGGPLFYTRDERQTLAGIVSWGEGCAEPGNPGVYTRVSSFRAWVETEVKRYDGFGGDAEDDNIAELVQMFCYDGLAIREHDQANGKTLEATQWLDVAGPFTPRLTRAPQGETACMFTLPSGRDFSVTIEGAKTSNPGLLVTSEGESWQGSVETVLDLKLKCQDEEIPMDLHLSQHGGFGDLVLANRSLEFSTDNPVATLPSVKEQAVCALGGTTFHYLEATEENRFFVRLASDFLPASPLTYELLPLQRERRERPAPLGISLAMHSAKSGALRVENYSARKVFGWQLACSFSFTLKDPTGETAQANLQAGTYQVQYSAADKRHGVLPARGGVTFELTSDEILDPLDQSKTCSINGYPVPLSQL